MLGLRNQTKRTNYYHSLEFPCSSANNPFEIFPLKILAFSGLISFVTTTGTDISYQLMNIYLIYLNLDVN